MVTGAPGTRGDPAALLAASVREWDADIVTTLLPKMADGIVRVTWRNSVSATQGIVQSQTCMKAQVGNSLDLALVEVMVLNGQLDNLSLI